MHKGRVVLDGLHKVWRNGILQQHRHCTISLQIPRINRGLVAAIRNNDVSQTGFEVSSIARQTKNSHHFGRNRDVKSGLAGIAVGCTTQPNGDLAQRPVVHIHHTPPCYAAAIDIERVAPVDVVVDERSQQIVRGGDGVKIACEVQVDVFHGHDLRFATARCASLHTKAGSKGGLAQANDRLFADQIECITKANRCCGFTLARWCRVNGGDKNELAILAVGQRAQESRFNFRFVMPKGNKTACRDTQFRANLCDRMFLGCACNIDI